MAEATPRAWLDGAVASHRRLRDVLDRVDDDVVARPSLLPGWTVGHVLSHLARNADAVVAMLHGAAVDEVVAQYPGGPEQRIADVEAGACRSAEQVRADVVESAERLDRAWADTTGEVWATGLGTVFAGPVTVAEMVFRRWREVEIHVVDLDLPGVDWADLSPAYVDVEWERTLAGVPARLDAGDALVLVPGDRPSRAFGTGATPVVVREPPAVTLGWLLGRTVQPDRPVLGPWTG